MKKLKYILLVVAVTAFVGCETLPDPEVEMGPIKEMSGEWMVSVTDEGGATITPLAVLRTYNTADNARDKAWIRFSTAAAAHGIWGKVNCDLGARTFSGTDVANTLKAAGNTFSLSEAKIMLNASFQHTSGATADSIYMVYTSTSAPGKTYTAKGHRRTRWDDVE